MGAFADFLASVRLRTWLAVCVLAIAIIVDARITDHYTSAGPLQFTYDADWWYQQDAAHQVIVNANNANQNTTLIRSGQRQGYVVAIRNPTTVTQTIVGDGSGPTIGWGNPGGGNEQVAVSSSYTDIANGFAGERVAGHVRFTLPVSIPPFQTRLVRVFWTSDICLQNGETSGIDKLYLRVRVG